MATVDKMTLFDLAEKQMFDQVQKKVLDALVAEYTEMIRQDIKGMLAEYASSEIVRMSDHATMREEFIIWIKHNDEEKKEMV